MKSISSSTPKRSFGEETSDRTSTKNHVDLKVIILGNGRVGKTSFICRYINDEFTDTISDTAGQEKFSRISSYYCRGAQAAIVTYDITDASTLEALPSYISFLNEADRDCFIIVIGTKLDLAQQDPSRRQVSEEQGREFARTYRAPFFETSAKSNINISIVFDTIGYHCLSTKLSQKDQLIEKRVPNPGAKESTAMAQSTASNNRACCNIS